MLLALEPTSLIVWVWSSSVGNMRLSECSRGARWVTEQRDLRSVLWQHFTARVHKGDVNSQFQQPTSPSRFRTLDKMFTFSLPVGL